MASGTTNMTLYRLQKKCVLYSPTIDWTQACDHMSSCFPYGGTCGSGLLSPQEMNGQMGYN